MTALRRRRGRDGQAGITVVEMTVVVALLGVVLAMAFQGLYAYQRAASGSEARLRNLDEARLAMAVLTKDLRTATTFRSPLGERDVTFKANLNTGATALENEVRLYVDGAGVLREAVRPPDTPVANPPTYTGAWTTRIVGRGVVARTSASDPLLFDYLDADGVRTTDPAAVASVDITLRVDVPSAVDVQATTLASRVLLPNVAAAAEEEEA